MFVNENIQSKLEAPGSPARYDFMGRCLISSAVTLETNADRSAYPGEASQSFSSAPDQVQLASSQHLLGRVE